MYKAILVVLSLAFVLIGYSFYNPVRLAPMTLCLEWLINPHHGPLVVGIEKGFFKEVGIDLKLIPAGSAQEGSKQVAFGKADLAISSQPQMMIKIGKGLPLVRVATMIPTTLEVFVSKVPLSELKGKKIGHCSSLGFSGAVLQRILKKANLNTGDIQETLACNGLAQALLTGKVDAVMNMYRSYAVADIEQFDQKIISFNIEDFGIPIYDEMLVVANSNLKNSEKLAAFVKALKKSLNFVQDNPAAAWKIFVSAYPEQDTKVNKQVWAGIANLFTRDPAPFRQETYQSMEAFLQDHGLLDRGQTHRYAVDLLE